MLVLKNFESSDFEQLIEWIKDEELLMNWCGSLFSYPLTTTSLQWYIEDINVIESSLCFIYKAVDTDTGLTVGHISLGSISKKNSSGRISRVLIGNTNNRGKGYCQQMIKAIIKIGFEELKLHRISLGVYDFNTSAIGCYQKAGFTIEGTTRDVLNYKGAWWSLIEMSILEDEWKIQQKRGNL